MAPQHEIDAQALQAAIEASARTAGPEPPFAQLALQQLKRLIHETATVEPNPLLLGRTTYERVWVVINRAIRRIARHGVEPCVQQQNELNTRIKHTLDLLITADAALQAELIRIRADTRHES